MSDPCIHCRLPLGPASRSVKGWFARRWVHGRACLRCWSRTLLGSLLYTADVCHRLPCDCGWCEEWAKLKEAK